MVNLPAYVCKLSAKYLLKRCILFISFWGLKYNKLELTLFIAAWNPDNLWCALLFSCGFGQAFLFEWRTIRGLELSKLSILIWVLNEGQFSTRSPPIHNTFFLPMMELSASSSTIVSEKTWWCLVTEVGFPWSVFDSPAKELFLIPQELVIRLSFPR